jgi:hypothetical protein
VDQYVEAQKKLMNLAIHEMETAARTAVERVQKSEPEPRTTLADATQKTVHNIVAAQKSLMDLAVPPEKPPAAERARTKAALPAKRKK